MTNTPGEDATQAMGAADWVRGGVVQDALNDAAARAAASNPAIADVVRREQDAKNEVMGLRKYLAGEAGAANSPLPSIAVHTPSALKYSDIPALPDTREELLAIDSTLQADPARDVLLGANATRESVLAVSKSGLLANLNQPALAMAATGAEAKDPLSPLLTLEDVLTLKLNADWVVLSACNTAAADGKAEEALSGLARGFFYAGSRSLLVTHWAVDSESAKLLTAATFAHYTANPQAAKAESLRQAMLKVMAMPQYSHPAYWAPYALVGDGGR